MRTYLSKVNVSSFLPNTHLGLFAGLTAALLAAACSSPETGSSTSGSAGGAAAGSAGVAGATTTGGSAGSAGQGGAGAAGTGGTGGAAGTGGGGFDPEAGWTPLTESADTRKVYVSSSTGDDANDGLSPDKAVKTIAAGIKLVRDGFPDWLLLMRGDVWTNENFGKWSKSGKSPTEPIVVSYYGDMSKDRPFVKTGDKSAIQTYDSPNTVSPINYVSLIGLHLSAHTRDPSDPGFTLTGGPEGIRWLTKTDGLLLEDILIQFYDNDITIQGDVDKPITNVKIRRSVIADAYSGGAAHSQGIFTAFVSGLTIEENLFDHNGWSEQVPAGTKTIFNHNMYIHQECTGLVVQRNISARASSHGLQARPGGTVADNLFVQDALGFSFGLVHGSPPAPGGVTGDVHGNVILEGTDIDANNPRGYGIELGNIKSATIADNIIAHNKSSKNSSGLALELTEDGGVGLNDVTFSKNVVYDWHGDIQVGNIAYKNVLFQDNSVQDPAMSLLAFTQAQSWPAEVKLAGNVYFSGNDPSKWFSIGGAAMSLDQFTSKTGEQGAMSMKIKYKAPDRTLGDYSATLGKGATFDAFMAEARKQARGHYLYEYTTKPPLDYIRDGFTVLP